MTNKLPHELRGLRVRAVSDELPKEFHGLRVERIEENEEPSEFETETTKRGTSKLASRKPAQPVAPSETGRK